MFERHRVVTAAVLTLAALLSASALGAELPAGTTITKDNVDRLKSETFEGKTIGSMLTERTEWQIRNWNLKITLARSKPLELDPKFVAATKKHSGSVTFDPSTREVAGWKAGMPFPNVDPSDPHAGDKLIWNTYLANSEGGVAHNTCSYFYISGDKGVDKIVELYFLRYYMKGRLDKENPVLGDGRTLSKTLLVFTYPYDMKGLSTFTIRHDTPQLEDNWVYVKSVRRTRRLSGSSWMDPIGGSDQLNDDIYVFNARPSWYSKLHLVGKRWILAMADGRATRDFSKKGTPDEYPNIDLKNAPHWNPVDSWQPREVYVIEATPPDGHPYGKKVVYTDANYPWIWQGEVYDKKGEFWKMIVFSSKQMTGQSGIRYNAALRGHTIDFKARHATIFSCHRNVQDEPLTETDVSIHRLEAENR